MKAAPGADDVGRSDPVPNPTAPSGLRRAPCVEESDDPAMEPGAIPPPALRARLVAEVEARMDLTVLATVRPIETEQRRRLAEALGSTA